MSDGVFGFLVVLVLAIFASLLVLIGYESGSENTVKLERCVADQKVRLCEPWTSPIPIVELDDGGYLRPAR